MSECNCNMKNNGTTQYAMANIDPGTIRLARAIQAQNVQFRHPQFQQMATMHTGGNGVSDIAVLQRGQDKLAEAVAGLADFLGGAFPYRGRAGQIGGYSQEAGLTVVKQNGTLYKGGIGITSDIGVVSDTAPAGTIINVPWTGQSLQRVTGTEACRIGFTVSAATPTGGVLEDQAAFALVTLRINGFPVPEFSRVPLSEVINTLDGDQRKAAIRMPIPYDVSIDFQLELLAALGGGGGQSSNVFATLDTGTDCRY